MALKTHGMGNTPTYACWADMKRRCQNPKYKQYHYHGGRGIKICEKWQTFEGFFADMGEKPAGLSIERIDNDGNYEPDNCRWATHKEQMRNRSTTVMIGGESAGSVAERTGIPHWLLRRRLRAGHPIEKILSIESLPSGPKHKVSNPNA